MSSTGAEVERRRAALVERARGLEEAIASVHERVACPRCHAPVGGRCCRARRVPPPRLYWQTNGLPLSSLSSLARRMNAEEFERVMGPALKHPHRERVVAAGLSVR